MYVNWYFISVCFRVRFWAFSKDWCGCGKIVMVGKRHTPRRRGRPLRGKKKENLCIETQKWVVMHSNKKMNDMFAKLPKIWKSPTEIKMSYLCNI
jgi:hypothetical protein